MLLQCSLSAPFSFLPMILLFLVVSNVYQNVINSQTLKALYKQACEDAAEMLAFVLSQLPEDLSKLFSIVMQRKIQVLYVDLLHTKMFI